MGLMLITLSYLPPHRQGFLLRRIEDLHRLVGDGSQELGGRCFVVLACYDAVSNHRLVSVQGGCMLHDNLLLVVVSVMVDPLGQHHRRSRGLIGLGEIFALRALSSACLSATGNLFHLFRPDSSGQLRDMTAPGDAELTTRE